MSDRRCYRDDRCRDAEKVNGQLAGAPIHTETGLCLTCTGIVTTAITELPRDYVDLHLHLAPGQTAGEKVRSTRTPPAPIRVSLAALAADIAAEAANWAEPVADRLRIEWDSDAMDRHARPGHALQRACGILAASLPVLLNLRAVEVKRWAENGRYWTHEPVDGIDGALELLALHHRVRTVLGRTKLVHHLGVGCPSVECGVVALVRHNGSDDVTCEACGRCWPHEQWRRLTLVVADRGAAA